MSVSHRKIIFKKDAKGGRYIECVLCKHVCLVSYVYIETKETNADNIEVVIKRGSNYPACPKCLLRIGKRVRFICLYCKKNETLKIRCDCLGTLINRDIEITEYTVNEKGMFVRLIAGKEIIEDCVKPEPGCLCARCCYVADVYEPKNKTRKQVCKPKKSLKGSFLDKLAWKKSDNNPASVYIDEEDIYDNQAYDKSDRYKKDNLHLNKEIVKDTRTSIISCIYVDSDEEEL